MGTNADPLNPSSLNISRGNRGTCVPALVHPYQQRNQRQNRLRMSESEVSHGLLLALKIEIVLVSLQELPLRLSSRLHLQIVRADSREHRSPQHARHLHVQSLPAALAGPQLRVLGERQVLQNAGLAQQQRAAPVINVITRSLDRILPTPPPRIGTSNISDRTGRSGTGCPARGSPKGETWKRSSDRA